MRALSQIWEYKHMNTFYLKNKCAVGHTNLTHKHSFYAYFWQKSPTIAKVVARCFLLVLSTFLFWLQVKYVVFDEYRFCF